MKPLPNPKHVSSLYIPHAGATYFVSYPEKKLERFKGYRKYCHRTHRHWWLMKKEDYGEETVILCGYCEYTSILDDAEEEL